MWALALQDGFVQLPEAVSGNHFLAALYAQSSLDRIEYLKKCLFFYQLIVIGM